MSGVGIDLGKGLELPRFYENNPTLWFKVIETSFRCHDIAEPKQQIDITLRALGVKQLQQIEHLLCVDQHPENPYEVLKQNLLKENLMSENERLYTLLHWIHLGNSPPTEMLCKLRRLMIRGTNKDADIPLLKKLFLDKLPNEVRRLLAATGEENLEMLAKRADDVMAATPSRSTNTTVTDNFMKHRNGQSFR